MPVVSSIWAATYTPHSTWNFLFFFSFYTDLSDYWDLLKVLRPDAPPHRNPVPAVSGRNEIVIRGVNRRPFALILILPASRVHCTGKVVLNHIHPHGPSFACEAKLGPWLGIFSLLANHCGGFWSAKCAGFFPSGWSLFWLFICLLSIKESADSIVKERIRERGRRRKFLQVKNKKRKKKNKENMRQYTKENGRNCRPMGIWRWPKAGTLRRRQMIFENGKHCA